MKKTYKQWMAKPDLAVIDRAIQLIKEKRTTYSCVALGMALAERTTLYHDIYCQYASQYKQTIFTHDGVPWWWNYSKYAGRERVAALRRFKKACIKAGERA